MGRMALEKEWRAIGAGTAVFLPAYGLLLAGLVSAAPGRSGGIAHPLVAVGAGVALLPAVFLVLARLSDQPRLGRTVARATGVAFLVGVFVSAPAGDGVTGLIAAVGAGGAVALPLDERHSARPRIAAVALAAAYVFVAVRTGGPIGLLAAPLLPLSGLGLADHLSARRHAPDPSIA
jgi:hypothetical protein